MKRAVFFMSGAALLVGCGGEIAGSPLPESKRSIKTTIPAGPPDGGSPTPNPIDPATGLAIIGGTTARWNGPALSYGMSSSYVDDTGADVYNARELQIAAQDFSRYLTRCAAETAAAAGAAQTFIDKAFSAFGPRLTAAVAGATYTELSLWEAVGVALATLTAGEVAGIVVALGITVTLLYAAYICASHGA